MESEMEDVVGGNVCQLCSSARSKYVCPRCNVSYCSVDCYKSPSHSDCSEEFYKGNIQEWLAAEGTDPKAKLEMVEILKRMNQCDDEFGDEESEPDSDEEESLAERMAMVDLDNPDELWAKLLPEERQEFLELVKNGDVAKLVPEWDPWWEEKHPTPKVRFVDDSSEPEYKSSCPEIRSVPEFSRLTKTEPSPQVYYNLINVLAAYSVTARYMNGDFTELPREAATILVDVSKNLSANAIFNDLDSAVESVNQCVIDCPWITLEPDAKRGLRVSHDVTCILEGPNDEEPLFYTKAALSEAIDIMCAAKNRKERRRQGKFSAAFPEPTEASPLTSKSTLSKCIKKLEYYLSWTDKHLSAFRMK